MPVALPVRGALGRSTKPRCQSGQPQRLGERPVQRARARTPVVWPLLSLMSHLFRVLPRDMRGCWPAHKPGFALATKGHCTSRSTVLALCARELYPKREAMVLAEVNIF